MPTTSPLFDINQFNTDQQKNFHATYDQLKPNHISYLQYKRHLQLKTKFDDDEAENEWHYELHRFLRARKWNVAQTVKSIQEMLQWRMDNQVDCILEHQPTVLRMDLLRQMAPNMNHGHTKAQRPIYIEKSGLMPVNKLLTEFTPEELTQCHIYWLEFYCQLARERSRQLGKHVESFALIHDLNGCKIEMRKVLPLFRRSLYIDENYYPERLGQMFLVNPPAIFPLLWNIAKPWLDPVTKAKILVIKRGSETAATLLEHIDSDQLPREYGGSCRTCPMAPDCLPAQNLSKTIEEDEK